MKYLTYYNENDKKAAAWLRELIKRDLIAPGFVDERSIKDVKPDELREYKQVHLFAGIGGWSRALRLAGVQDDAEVWTGSCPCQPFSGTGKHLGTADERHLWPEMFRLVRERHPPIIFSEQVERAIAEGWLDAVSNDLEGIGYAIGSAVLPACSVGSPHKRERLWLVASDNRSQRVSREVESQVHRKPFFSWCEDVRGPSDLSRRPDLPKPLVCRLSDGLSNGVDLLHGMGNAIVPQVAAEFISAYIETQN